MDFSSIPRSLESLARRQPRLDDAVIAVVKQLQKEVAAGAHSEAASFYSHLEQLLSPYQGSIVREETESESSKSIARWEPLAVGLFVATQLLQQQQAASNQIQALPLPTTTGSSTQPVYMEGPRVPEETPDSALLRLPLFAASEGLDAVKSLKTLLHSIALTHMEHAEPRVRTYVAKAVGAYCQVSSTTSSNGEDGAAADDFVLKMQRDIHERLLGSIAKHLQEGRPEQPTEGGDGDAKQVNVGEEEDDKETMEPRDDTLASSIARSPQEYLQYSRDSTGALDDTTGWRALETNWQCLAALVSAMGAAYVPEFGLSDTVLQNCQYCAVAHKNRHVRAAAMAVLEQWIVATVATKNISKDVSRQVLLDQDAPLRKTVAVVLKTGLADNWSQVRMAASVLCRVLFVTLQDNDCSVEDLYPTLLPRMCLNRFYLAQGVKLYSHQSWKLVVKNSGLDLVAKYLPAVCRYYVQMADADNHVVREGACQAIAELATKLGSSSTEYHDLLVGHLEMLIQALLMCFHDESWPVRDEACLACGLLCKAYPEECRPELKVLWERWSEQLTDQIWSVREDAAVALGDALEAYGEEFLVKIRELIKKILPAAKDQPALSQEEYKAHVNNAELHTDSQLYSCGSLAPKLRKGGAGRIGCSNCGIDRPKAPWEATDGCIYLIRELCVRCCSDDKIGTPLELKDDELLPLLRELADVCRVQHFPQSSELRATLWRQLPSMAHAIGKNRFKKLYLEVFTDLMFANIESRSASQLSIHAAGQCADDLAQFVGPSIFRARLEDYQQQLFDKVIRERQQMPKGPAVLADGTIAPFSPYGPHGLLDSVHKMSVV